MKLSILILAAGNSSRLGQPKQLIEFEGQTLIERVTETALMVSDNILIIFGGNSELIIPKIERFSDTISTIFNPNWQQGMGTSIRIGVENLAEKSDAILILLSDQPFISSLLLKNMIQIFQKSLNPIVSCLYNQQLGVPMLFDKSVFPELIKLSGDRGAKSFLHLYKDNISTIDFPEGIIDIDTFKDLEKLKKH